MMVVQVVSYIPNYALYTQGADAAIIISHIMSSAVFILSVSVLVLWNKALAIPISLVLVYLFLLFYKYNAYHKLRGHKCDR